MFRSLVRSSKIITQVHPTNPEISILRMNNPPVNALSKQFMADLQKSIQDCERDEKTRAVILTSNKPGVFCAGLDLKEIWRKSEEEIVAFWTQIQDTSRTLYGSQLLTVAAINGTSPAGGTLLAFSCDHRVMVDHPKFRIGLNETQLGLAAPEWFKVPYQNLLGNRRAEKYLYQGTLLSVADAHRDGLVDDVCRSPEPAKLLEITTKITEEYLGVPQFALIGTKQVLRQDHLDHMDRTRERDLAYFVATSQDEGVQKSLDGYMAMLSKPKNK